MRREFISGIKILIESFCEVRAQDVFVVVYQDKIDSAVRASIVAEAKLAAREVLAFSANSSFEEIVPSLRDADVVLFLEDERSTFPKELREAKLLAQSDKKRRIYRLFNTSEWVISEGFRLPKQVLLSLNQNIIAAGSRTRRVRVESKIGTSLIAELDDQYGWINSVGEVGSFPGILPPSEVATYASMIDGTIIADGAITANIDLPFDPRLAGHPVELTVRDGWVKAYSSPNMFVSSILMQLSQLPNGLRIGELGFGSNIGLRAFASFACHLNERKSSFHVGLGAHQQGNRVDWSCPLHVDFVLNDCDIYFDDKLIHRDGEYFVDEAAIPAHLSVGLADAV